MKKLLYVCLLMSVTTSAFAQRIVIEEEFAQPVTDTRLAQPVEDTSLLQEAVIAQPVADTRLVQEAVIAQPVEEAYTSEYEIASPIRIISEAPVRDASLVDSVNLADAVAISACRDCLQDVAIDTSGTLSAATGTGGVVAVDSGSTVLSGGPVLSGGGGVVLSTGTTGTVVNTTVTAVNPYADSTAKRATFNLQYANIVGADGAVSSGSHSDAVKSDFSRGKFKSVGYQFSVTETTEEVVCLSGSCLAM
jgi:hypothetical protein